jgi:hypothetical protein
MTHLNNAQLQEQLDKSPSFVKVSKDMIDSRIATIDHYVWPGTTTTLCRIEIDNGFSVIGQSACVDKANFNPHIGETLAFQDAYDKLWGYFGFMLAEAVQAAKVQGIETQLYERLGLQDGA